MKKIKLIIRAKAPFRVSFGGGGTDMPPYCVDHGGCVISTAIDRYAYVSVSPRKDDNINVFSPDFEKKTSFNYGDKDYSEDFELFKGVINVFNIQEGFDIITHSDLPPGSGMGGSSSLAVALIGAFNEYYDLGLNPHEIAQKACDVERIELDQKGGYQDQYAAAYGGFNFIEFTREVKVTPINLEKNILNELQYRMILCYVGGSHFSSNIQDELLSSYELEKKSFMEAMEDLKDIAKEMKKVVESGDCSQLPLFGELLHKGWLAKKSLSSKISNSNVERFYLTSRKYGVVGGKLLGAGGGGHLLLFSDPDKKFGVIRELEQIGGKIINFHFNPNGLEVWRL